jgi:hypothetical protein
VEAIEALVELGADMKARNARGLTPLQDRTWFECGRGASAHPHPHPPQRHHTARARQMDWAGEIRTMRQGTTARFPITCVPCSHNSFSLALTRRPRGTPCFRLACGGLPPRAKGCFFDPASRGARGSSERGALLSAAGVQLLWNHLQTPNTR